MLTKKYIFPLGILLGFVCLFLFISTSITLNYSSGEAVRTVAVGFGTPWFQQVSRSDGGSQELNLLASSFLLGILGILLIGSSYWYFQKGEKVKE